MRFEANGITIHLDQTEIADFWNIIMFALDLQAEREKKGESCMHKSELAMAKKLVEIVEEFK